MTYNGEDWKSFHIPPPNKMWDITSLTKHFTILSRPLGRGPWRPRLYVSLYYIKRKLKFALRVLGQDRSIANQILMEHVEKEGDSS